MGAEIDEYYAVFKAQTAPFVAGVEAMAVASEQMTVAVTGDSAAVTAAQERMILRSAEQAKSYEEMALEGQVSFDKLAASAAAASASMERAAARAAASNDAITASVRKAETAQTEASMAGAKRLAMGAAGFALVTAAVVHMAADFQTQTTTLVTTAGETESALGQVRQGMLEMAGQVGDTADQLAKAMYTVESGGFHAADGLTVLRAAAEGAKAENADLGTVADAVTSVLQDYHLKASDAATVTSKLVAAVGAGKTNFQDFAGALHSVLPIASSAHVSLDDVSGALASMTVHGMSAAQASENMADAIKHMLAPTGVQVKELGQLHMSASDLADMLSSKGLTGTMQTLSQTILSQMGPSGRVMLNSFNMSRDAANGANTMIAAMQPNLQKLAVAYRDGNVSLGDWRKTLKAMPADQANLLSQFASLQNRASGFNDILKSGAPAAQTYQDALRRVTGDATGMNVALMLTGENTGYVNGAVKKVSAATAEAGNHVKGWHDIQNNFNQKLNDAKAGMGALAIEVGEKLLPPLTVFFGWLATGAEFLAKHKMLATYLAVALGVLTVGFTIAAVAVWAMNSAFLANPVTWIILAIVAAIALVSIGIYELVKHWGAIWKWVKDVALDVWHWLVKVWNDIVDAVKKFWQHDIVDPIKEAWDNVKKWTGDAVDWFKALPGRIWDALKALPGKLEQAASEGMHRLMFAIGYGLGMAVKITAELPGKVWHIITSLWDGAVKLVKEGAHKVVEFFGTMKDDAIAIVEAWWHLLISSWTTGINLGIKITREMPGKILKFFEDMWHGAVHITETMVHDAVAFLTGLPGKAWDAVKALPGKVKSVASDAGTWLLQAGKDIVNGAINGFTSVAHKMLDTVKSWGHDIASGFKSALGIASPSRVFHASGVNIVEGLIQGITAGAPGALAAVTDLADQMTLAPKVSMSIGAGGVAGYAPSIPAQWRPQAAGDAGDDRNIRIEIPVMLDSKEVFRAVVPHAQQSKNRNATTQLT